MTSAERVEGLGVRQTIARRKYLKRIISSSLAVILALVTMVTGVSPALADNPNGNTAQPAGVAIQIQPEAAVKQSLEIKIVERGTQNQVVGATVYALGVDLAETVQDQAKSRDYSSLLNAYASAARDMGVKVGVTGDQGTLTYAFQNVGRYILFSSKEGFTTGFARVTVKESLANALKLDAPFKARVGEQIKIRVTGKQYPKHKAVEGAEVYALEVDPGEANGLVVKPEEDDQGNLGQKYTDTAKTSGVLLGKTDADGILNVKFDDSGMRVLVAYKEGYTPAFCRMLVNATVVALHIQSPPIGLVNQATTFKVYEGFMPKPFVLGRAPESSGPKKPPSTSAAGSSALPPVTATPVPDTSAVTSDELNAMPLPERKVVGGVDLYGVKLNVAGAKDDFLDIPDTDKSDANDKLVEQVKKRGFLMGTTDVEGKIVYSFTDAGNYMVIAIKKGYIPGHTRMNVVSEVKKGLIVKAPRTVIVQQAVTISVAERWMAVPSTAAAPTISESKKPATANLTPPNEASLMPMKMQPVAGAAVYLLKIGDLLPETSARPVEPSTSPEEYAVMATSKGLIIGKTDENGKLSYTFGAAGRYVLVVTKDGYTAGFARVDARLLVKETPKPTPVPNLKPGTQSSR
jgi:hypothetical protein